MGRRTDSPLARRSAGRLDDFDGGLPIGPVERRGTGRGGGPRLDRFGECLGLGREGLEADRAVDVRIERELDGIS